MRPIRPRHARILRLVKELLIDADANKAPIDVEYIARSKGASIQFEKFDVDVSGVLVRPSANDCL